MAEVVCCAGIAEARETDRALREILGKIGV